MLNKLYVGFGSIFMMGYAATTLMGWEVRPSTIAQSAPYVVASYIGSPGGTTGRSSYTTSSRSTSYSGGSVRTYGGSGSSTRTRSSGSSGGK